MINLKKNLRFLKTILLDIIFFYGFYSLFYQWLKRKQLQFIETLEIKVAAPFEKPPDRCIDETAYGFDRV